MIEQKTAIIIGRFQPPHKGHIESLIKPAIEECNQVLILIGSSNKAPTIKDPFSYRERMWMILEILEELELPTENIRLLPLEDRPYNNTLWQVQVQKVVREYAKYKPILYGAEKDKSSFYLKFFPQWQYKKQPVDKKTLCNSTDIRELLFTNPAAIEEQDYLYNITKKTLLNFLNYDIGIKLTEEFNFIQKYKEQFRDSRYPPIFQTVDNVILWRGNILLIRRKAMPGKGLWALPGGFIKDSEWLYEAAIRELNEETNIKFYDSLELRKNKLFIKKEWLVKENTFDHPTRSLRGRTITTAYFWKIPDQYEIDIMAADDASDVRWFPLIEALKMGSSLFEDHVHIIYHSIIGNKEI